jgi:hypothetical protein
MARAHLACLNEHIRSIQANGVDNVYCIINREFECQPQANFGALNGSGLKNTGFQHDGKAWNAQVLSPMIGEHSPVCGDFNKRAYRYNPISYPGTHPNAATYSELGGRHVTSRDFWSMVEWIATGSSPLGQQPFLEWKNGKLYRKQAFRRNPKVYA